MKQTTEFHPIFEKTFEMEKKIITPYDFTKVSEIALEHALLMGQTIKATVYVTHIIDNKFQVADAKRKLQSLKEWVKSEKGTDIETIVRIGNIFEDIDKVSSEMEADLIIMGTHGIRGMQFLTGSRALKIVTESLVPFIVTQERNIRPQGYHKLVVPMDLHKETKQKLASVGNMAKYFNSKVYLVSPDEKDEFLKNQLERNLAFATEYLEGRGIDYEMEMITGKSDFVKSMLKYSAAIEADLICIVNSHDSGFMGMFSSSEEQQVINNDAQIPVLCVNAVTTTIPDIP
jgi:nucleotide-binding universal stress UspA family protein